MTVDIARVPNSGADIVRLFRELLGVGQGVAVLVSALLVSAIELVGLALIFPFIKLVTDLAFFSSISTYLRRFADLPWLVDQRTVVLVAGTLLLVFYVAKGLVHTALIRYQAQVAARINSRASQGLIDTALQARYQLFLRHGGVKIAGVSYSNTTHAALLFQAVIAGCNELILIGSVFLAAFVFAPLVTLSLLSMIGVVASIFFIPFSRRISRIGRETQALDLSRHRFVFAMASAIKDIKIMGLEPSFMARNRLVVDQHVALAASYQSISAGLRIAVEVLLACGVVGVCMWLGYSGHNLLELAPLLGMVAMVAVRVGPALSRLMGAYNGFRYSLPFIEGLLEMRAEVARYPQVRRDQPVNLPGAYAASGLSFAYEEHLVLDQVSLEIPRGAVVGVVGPSGSGKSTLLDLLAGLQPPSAGGFSVDGTAFSPFESREFSQKVGYVQQTIALLDASLSFNICLEDHPDPQRLRDAMRKAHLDEFVAGLKNGVDTLLGEGGQGVSGGQRQRIGIARALYRAPDLLILDEITSALDPETERHVMRELLELRGETSILIVTHRMATVAEADIVYELDGGKLTRTTRRAQGL